MRGRGDIYVCVVGGAGECVDGCFVLVGCGAGPAGGLLGGGAAAGGDAGDPAVLVEGLQVAGDAASCEAGLGGDGVPGECAGHEVVPFGVEADHAGDRAAVGFRVNAQRQAREMRVHVAEPLHLRGRQVRLHAGDGAAAVQE